MIGGENQRRQQNYAYRLGLQLTNHVFLYASSAGFTFVVSLVNLGFLTHYLSVGDFGRLAVLLVFAALLTILYNLVLLQGTFGLVFRGGGDDEGGFDMADEPAEASGIDKRRTLTTGLLLTFGVCAGGTVVVWVFAEAFSSILGDVPANWVRLAALSGASGSLWRFVLNVFRFERRPASFAAMTILRPLAVLGLSIPLVVNGHGVPGVLVATTVGTLVAVIAALALSVRNYSTSVQWSSLGAIGRRGGYLVPVIVSFWIINNVDLYLLSLWGDPADTAHYRVAARLAAGMSYFVSAFLMAWMPLSRTVVHQVISEEHGSPKVGGTMVLYYWAAACWVILGLALLSDLLVRVAPATYGPAAPLIPIIAASFVAYGVLVVLHRVGTFRLGLYVALSAYAAAVFTAAALLLIPEYGAYGAAIAPLFGFGTAVAVELYFVHDSDKGIDIPYPKVAAASAVAVAIWLTGHLLAHPAPEDGVRLIPDLILMASFPLLLSRLGVIDLPSINDIRASGRRARESAFLERLPGEGTWEWELAQMLLSERRPTAEVAAASGVKEQELLVRFSEIIEGIADTMVPESTRAETAHFLLMRGPTSLRDDAAARILADGVAPEALVDIESAFVALKRAVRRAARTEPAPALGTAADG